MEKLGRKASMCIFLCLLILAGTTVGISQNNITKVNFVEKQFNGKQAPVKIVKYSVAEGEDWLKGLTIEVQNVSNKPIYFFRYAGVAANEFTSIGSHISLVFNKELQLFAERDRKLLADLGSLPLNPRETAKIVIEQQRYEWFKIRESKGEISPINKIDFTLQSVYYGDGTYWIGGTEHTYLNNTTSK